MGFTLVWLSLAPKYWTRVEVIGGCKHSSLLLYGNNYCRKKFYSIGSSLRIILQTVLKCLLRDRLIFLFFSLIFWQCVQMRSFRLGRNYYCPSMDKLQLTRQNLGWVFNSRSDCMPAVHLFCYVAKQPNLKLKTRSKQVLGPLLLAFVLPGLSQGNFDFLLAIFIQCQWWIDSNPPGPCIIKLFRVVIVAV